ncbi:hypothetical protein [Pseudodesulfovibrio senegalensis]|uniref:Pilin n=1 Tax=Pseudodesulfovibrio senegalensis TaxID=1721087 RepID=A0A6N6N792_9BACT|nr:hypothetical protein [Pseudodesulfovibrio senegalensis]KAB1443578.1 hypothetical protein F8A88_04855 [Pseudodesulfovibrio senegalensis]
MQRKAIILILLTFLLIGFAGFGCAGQHDQAMYSLSVELNKLTTAAEGYEHYMKPDPGMSDEEFLKNATEHDPGLLKPFESYKLNVERQDGHVSILVCTPDGHQALLQDVGCTNQFDQHLWQSEPAIPCESVQDGFSVCGAN